jgi:peptidoglycan/LPS O-acetylase OafA/YrhL
MRRIAELDSLRGVAALVVVLHHYWVRYVPFGWISVDLFFVLSGYLITSIILKGAEDRYFLRTFYIRRSLRIWPIYYIVLAALLVVLPLIGRADQLANFPYFLTYTQFTPLYWSGQAPGCAALSHTWTLAIEEQFYLIWPALMLIAGRRRAWVVVLGSILLAVTMRSLRFHEFLLAARCDGLALGGGLALLLGDAARVARARGRLVAGFALVLAVALPYLAWILLFRGGTRALAPWPLLRSLTMLTINLAFVSLVGLVVLNVGSPLLRPLRLRPLSYLGQISYGLYLYHVPILILLEYAAEASGARIGTPLLLLGLALTFGVSALSWAYVERPILALKDRFEYRPAGGSGEAAPSGVGPPRAVPAAQDGRGEDLPTAVT